MEHPNDKMPSSEMMIDTTEDELTKIETTFRMLYCVIHGVEVKLMPKRNFV